MRAFGLADGLGQLRLGAAALPRATAGSGTPGAFFVGLGAAWAWLGAFLAVIFFFVAFAMQAASMVQAGGRTGRPAAASAALASAMRNSP